MKSKGEHKIVLKKITDFAFSYGVDAIKSEVKFFYSPKTWSKKITKLFLEKCQEGFKLAQDLIIEEILYYQKLVREKKVELKESRQQRNKPVEEKLRKTISIIEHRLSTFSHIADGIAWQMIQRQIHIARRLYIGESQKFLDSSNLQHSIKVSKEINEKPDHFALISDLTNFVQIGDLLIRYGDKIGITELKEGVVNEKVADLVKKMNDLEYPEEDLKNDIGELDKNTQQQVTRVVKQQEKAFRALELINTDKGKDPKSGTKISIASPQIPTETYSREFSRLAEKLKESDWAFDVLDAACLYIGLYKGIALPMAHFGIQGIIKETTPNYIVVDLMSIVNNVSEPLFAKPLSPDLLIDIVVGDVKVIIGLDLDAFIQVLNDVGLEAKWLTEKETMKLIQKETMKVIFVHNKRAIQAKHPKGNSLLIGGGIISKILFDSIPPTNIAFTLLETLSKTK